MVWFYISFQFIVSVLSGGNVLAYLVLYNFILSTYNKSIANFT